MRALERTLFQSGSRFGGTFLQLPEPAQRALIWRWLIENEHGPQDILEQGISSPLAMDEETWETLVTFMSKRLGKRIFFYLEVPVDDVKSILLKTHSEIRDHATWEDYQHFYGGDIPEHGETHRLPCLAPTGDKDEVFEDGWHRLHSYINAGHKTIPILEY